MADSSVLVTYLRIRGWDKEYEEFWDSYHLHSTDDHDFDIQVREPGEPGYDVGVMISEVEKAARCGYSTIIFLGSHSQILSDNWCEQLVQASKFGAASATGSYEQGISSSFPNYHLRTNAFAINPKLLLSLWTDPVITKHDCHRFEHGDDSISRRLKLIGCKLVVAGRDGWYFEEDWPRSRTYRNGSQSNLIIGDNRTRAYEDADLDVKQQLEDLAWGARMSA